MLGIILIPSVKYIFLCTVGICDSCAEGPNYSRGFMAGRLREEVDFACVNRYRLVKVSSSLKNTWCTRCDLAALLALGSCSGHAQEQD